MTVEIPNAGMDLPHHQRKSGRLFTKRALVWAIAGGIAFFGWSMAATSLPFGFFSKDHVALQREDDVLEFVSRVAGTFALCGLLIGLVASHVWHSERRKTIFRWLVITSGCAVLVGVPLGALHITPSPIKVFLVPSGHDLTESHVPDVIWIAHACVGFAVIAGGISVLITSTKRRAILKGFFFTLAYGFLLRILVFTFVPLKLAIDPPWQVLHMVDLGTGHNVGLPLLVAIVVAFVRRLRSQAKDVSPAPSSTAPAVNNVPATQPPQPVVPAAEDAHPGKTRMKKVAFVTLLACLLLGGLILTMLWLSGSKLPEMGGPATFSSKINFEVDYLLEPGGEGGVAGNTPQENPITVPSCYAWVVTPAKEVPIVTVVDEVKRENAPGLRLSRSVTDTTLKHVGSLKQLRTLVLTDCGEITDAGMVRLGKLAKLRWLSLNNCRKITDSGLANVRGLAELQEFYLMDCDKITDEALIHLKRIHALQRLNLSGCHWITGPGLAHLTDLPHLHHLDLSNCGRLGDSGLDHLKGMAGLQYLDLSGADITEAGIARLKDMTTLQELRLEHCHYISEDGFANLRKANPTLKIIRDVTRRLK